jgi:hypothetical protein
MALNPFRARREKQELEQRELAAFRAVRQAAREELRDLARYADDAPHSLQAARTALEAATTSEEVVAVEPYVQAARAALGVAEPEGRRGYQAVVDAASVAMTGGSPDQRVTDVRHQQRLDMERGSEWGGGS